MARTQSLILPLRETAGGAASAASAVPVSAGALRAAAPGVALAPPAVVPRPLRSPPTRRPRRGNLVVPLALGVLVLLAACALVPQWLAPYAPTDMQSDAVLAAPGTAHWFGTDGFGRDVLSLVIFGARQSLLIGVAAVAVGGGVGVAFGVLAGYVGGAVDATLMRATDVWMAVPSLLLAMALATALGPGTLNTILAISIASAPRYARVLRSQAIAVRGRTFIEAARVSGASHAAILRGHVLPHCAPQIMVMATLGVGTAILSGAALSFLGLGVNDSRPDWGYLLTQGRGYMTVAWWIVTFPGLAVTALVISINLLGDAMRRRLDPRRGRR